MYLDAPVAQFDDVTDAEGSRGCGGRTVVVDLLRFVGLARGDGCEQGCADGEEGEGSTE